LNNSVKSFTDELRIFSVEPKGVFIQIPLKVISIHASMIGPKKQSLDQGSNQMNAWKNTFLIHCFCLENLLMPIIFLLKRIVSLPTIGHYGTSGSNIGLDERHQFIPGTILDNLKPDAADAFPVLFGCHDHGKLILGATASFPAVPSANINFINFNHTGEFFPSIPDRATAKLMKPSPRGIIAAKPEQCLEGHRADAGFPGGEPPQRLKPQLQFLARPMEDCPCGKGMMELTIGTDEKLSAAQPVFGMPASAANKASGPAIPEKIIIAGLFIRKSLVEFHFIFREIFCNNKLFHCWPPLKGYLRPT
jgi:hypothetical protein